MIEETTIEELTLDPFNEFIEWYQQSLEDSALQSSISASESESLSLVESSIYESSSIEALESAVFKDYEIPDTNESVFLIFIALCFAFCFSIIRRAYARMGGSFGNFS